jgi:hypothetical protein
VCCVFSHTIEADWVCCVCCLGSGKELDPELRKRLLEQCPELEGIEDAFSSMGSDAADWLIDFTKLEIGPKIGRGTSSIVYRSGVGWW